MNKLCFIFATVTFLLSQITLADTLPKSFYNSCKVTVYETMFEELKGKDFYSVDTIEEKEGGIPSGEPAVFLKIIFHDSKGCQNRKVLGDCISMSDNRMGVRFILSDCMGKTILSSSQVIHLVP